MRQLYVILKAETSTDLEEGIEGHVEDGWETVGGPFVKGDLFYQMITIDTGEDP